MKKVPYPNWETRQKLREEAAKEQNHMNEEAAYDMCQKLRGKEMPKIKPELDWSRLENEGGPE